MKLFSSCFTAPQSKHLLVLTGIRTLVMVIATFIAIGASADDASPDGLTIPILTVGMFAVRYMATQQGWKYGRLVSNTAGLPSFPKTFPVMALMAVYALGSGYVSWLLFSWFNDDYNPGSSVLGLMALTLVVAFFTWLGVRVAAMRGYRLGIQPMNASVPTS
jgi:cation transporter-like permease